MAEININKISEKAAKAIPSKSAFDNTKAVYDAYVKKVSKSDFANSITLYEVELNMLNSMKEYAQKSGLSKECNKIEEKIKFAKEKLKELGIELK